MDVRKTAARSAVSAIAAALKSEHRFDLPTAWRETIEATLEAHIVIEESGAAAPPWTDPDASTLRIDPASIEPPEEDPDRVKRRG